MDSSLTAEISLVPIRFLQDPRTRNRLATLRVLSAMGSFLTVGWIANGDGFCSPSQNELAKILGISRPAVNHQIKILVQLGYVEIHTRYASDGGRMRNLYRIIFALPGNQKDRMTQ